MNKQKRIEILERFALANPNPTTELNFSNNFELLIAVLLSAQATDASVNKATAPLFKVANNPQAMYELGEEKVSEYIKTLNFFRTKAKNVIKTSYILASQYQGQVPDDQQILESLPGVGHKTANVVRNTAFGHPTVAVDTHIFRVCNRTNFAPGKDVVAVEEKLLRVVPKKYLYNVHHWLILHGRYICQARKPQCQTCPIADLCEFKEKDKYLYGK
ncbi:endonuclease III [Psittacicella melopsittaci]|uniref:Endonuclease III n=1 Tax=Psittacicella melopsittaci TaxID=2028576 RepID=A0A3A1Y387_9GAMM|nr:endonuclease III [Psittacicella melopsittaci]RIY31890.1 endonuclease III [Psittacicella melopsittaci]